MKAEILTALIAAGSALAGGTVTGWFAIAAAKRQAKGTLEAAGRQAEAAKQQADAAWAAGQQQANAAWEAGRRQAEAAWAAGQAQAQAQLDVAGRTLNAQALAAQREVRRAAYVTFLGRADTARQRHDAWQNALGTPAAGPLRQEFEAAITALREALTVIRLEGPDEATSAAETLEQALAHGAPGSSHTAAYRAFLAAARASLSMSP